MQCNKNADAEQGFALVAVLGFLMLLAIFLAPFAASARLHALLANNELQNRRLQEAANAINVYSIWRLSVDPQWRQRVERGEIDLSACRNAGTELFLSIIPHSRLININTAEKSLLAAGLEQIGINPWNVSQLVDDIITFRSPRSTDDDESRVQSGFKRAPIEDISELHDFNDLQDVPTSVLIRVFSPWAGRSLLQAFDSPGSPSQYFTTVTRIVTPVASGGDAAVYSAGENDDQGIRISTVVDALNADPAKTMTSCEDLLGVGAASILEHAG
jgi:hypothetical protein